MGCWRFLFLLSQFSQINFTDFFLFLQSFWIALRLDAVVISYFCLPIFLTIFLPILGWRNKLYQKFVTIYVTFLSLIYGILCIGDIQFFNELDFEICGSSHLDPIAKVNHDSAHHSGVLVFERCTDSALKINSVSNIMEPNSSIDQLDENLYESNETKKLILLYKNIKDKLLKNDIPAIRMSFCMSIHKIAAPQYYGGNELPPDWDSLKQILEKTNEYLES